MNYEITATLGPGSENVSMWKDMVLSGATSFRLNTSHLTLDQLHRWLEKIDPFLASLDPRPPLVLDLQGSKWRLGEFSAFVLEPGQKLELVCAASSCRTGVLPVPHPDFFQAAHFSSGEIVLNDARNVLEVEEAREDSMRARVTKGGEISARKGITYTSSTYRKETLNEKDHEILKQTSRFEAVRYALSYVKDASEMSRYRTLGGDSAYLIAKLERKSALLEAKQIALQADELWLCRGDLGAEIGLVSMAQAVHVFSGRLEDFTVPVFLAGGVLEHMTQHPAPTRSEICHLYDALTSGYQGIILSDETALGRYPVESCSAAAMFRPCPGISS